MKNYLEVPPAVLSTSVTYDVDESVFFGSAVSVSKGILDIHCTIQNNVYKKLRL